MRKEAHGHIHRFYLESTSSFPYNHTNLRIIIDHQTSIHHSKRRMSESQVNQCSNGSGDSAEVKNAPQKNAESAAVLDHQQQKPSAPTVASPAAGGDGQQLTEKDNNANTKASAEANNNNANTIQQLQEDLLKRTIERDEFRKKLEATERKLSALENNVAPAVTSDAALQRELEELRQTLSQTKLTLDERERRVATQDNHIEALSKQVSSLKEVVAITKDMLSIRNMEVKHLQEDVDKMESRIAAERDRHNAMLNKMDAAVRLNADLKKEYQTQLQLFQDLRGKYEEKVTLLSEENKALETAMQAQPAQ